MHTVSIILVLLVLCVLFRC